MSARITDSQRSAILDQVVNQYTAKGYKVADLRSTTAVLTHGKRWNWIAFIGGGIITGGILFVIYPLYYLFMGKSEVLDVNIDAAGNVKGTRRKV